jgi:hypothetical protein
VSKIIAFVCIATALLLCLWFAPWRSLAAHPLDLGSAFWMAGGLFTIAIAVLIRD